VIHLWRYALRLAPVRAVGIGAVAVVQGLLLITAPLLLGQVVGRLPGVSERALSSELLALLAALLMSSAWRVMCLSSPSTDWVNET
jgi:hypothetical protein